MKIVVESLDSGYIITRGSKKFGASDKDKMISIFYDLLIEPEEKPQKFEVGDRVECDRYGKGTISYSFDDDYLYDFRVRFDSGTDETYTSDGEYFIDKYNEHSKSTLENYKIRLI